MNYNSIYQSIISRAKHRINEGYVEIHHILPRCVGGSDDPSNLVALTAREHYIAHQLLVKIYPYNKSILHAAIMMTVDKHGGRVNNKLYGWLKERFSRLDRRLDRIKSVETKRANGTLKLSQKTKEKISQTKSLQPLELKQKGGLKNKGRVQSDAERKHRSEILKGTGVGASNSQFGKLWITNGIDNRFITRDCLIPDGWKPGRTCLPIGPRKK